jgi:DNA-damage-inducible protein J
MTTITLNANENLLKAQTVLNRMGLTPEQAVALFFEQIALRQELPFSYNKPNQETLEAFRDSETGKNLVECANAGDFFAKLGI